MPQLEAPRETHAAMRKFLRLRTSDLAPLAPRAPTRYNPFVDRPPGPRLPRMLQAMRVTAQPYGFMTSRWRRYGDVFSSHFPIFGRVVYVADPADIKRVFAGDPATFHAGEANAMALGDALGEHSLLTLDEGRHMSQRKLLLPAFHGESVRRYAEVMAEADRARGGPLAARPRVRAARRACRRSRSR